MMNTQESIALPELGEGVTEGELVRWLISEGDSIKIDQPLAEVMTDKAVMEIPSPVDGVVQSFSAKEGDTIPVGHNLLKLKPITRKAESQTDGSQTDRQKDTTLEGFSASDKANVPVNNSSTLSSPVKASPFTRQKAKELKVDLNQVVRKEGRVQYEDVLKYSKNPQIARSATRPDEANRAGEDSRVDGEDKTQVDLSQESKLKDRPVLGFEVPKEEGQERHPLKGIRKKIAQKMQTSKAVIPHFTLLESAEVEELEKLKSSAKESLKEKNIKVTYLPFIMKALLQTLKRVSCFKCQY